MVPSPSDAVPPAVTTLLRRLTRLAVVVAVAGLIATALALYADVDAPRAVLVGLIVGGLPALPVLIWRARVNVAHTWPRSEQEIAIVTVGRYRSQRVRATLQGSDLWCCVTIFGVETRCVHQGRASVYLGPGEHRALVVPRGGRVRWLRRLHEEPVSTYFPKGAVGGSAGTLGGG